MFAMRYKEIGLKIAYYRKKKGLTQAQLAEKVGKSTNYIGLIERGNNDELLEGLQKAVWLKEY